ncbi:MAG: M20/M25/M40 family metallo-hydrolase, partial [Thermoplasmatota archaeon]
MSLEKLKKDLVRLGRFGRKNEELIENFEDLDKDSGITRYSGSEADKKARDYIVQLMKEEGMEVKIDKVGNIFGIKEGSDPDLKSILVGSHIDTVTNGGMFDGALGVVSGIEAVRILKEEEFDNKRPIEVVVYTAEEGSSFPKSLLGSSFLIGDISVEEALETENEEGETLEEVLEKIGYKGD